MSLWNEFDFEKGFTDEQITDFVTRMGFTEGDLKFRGNEFGKKTINHVLGNPGADLTGLTLEQRDNFGVAAVFLADNLKNS